MSQKLFNVTITSHDIPIEVKADAAWVKDGTLYFGNNKEPGRQEERSGKEVFLMYAPHAWIACLVSASSEQINMFKKK